MIDVPLKTICQWASGRIIKSGLSGSINHVTIDSRGGKSGSLFVPVTGERHNGHTFIRDAALNGCSAALCDLNYDIPEDLPAHFSVIRVNDSLTALHAMASNYIRWFDIPVMAITGSNGKTTTKDMIAGVIGETKSILKNKGNYNNHLGMPLTIFDLSKQHEGIILEMGMSGLGEIRLLTKIAQPDIAYITNIGWAHIEKLGSKESIAEAKLEIAEGLTASGKLVINGDDSLLRRRAMTLTGSHRLVTVGVSTENDFTAENVIDQPGVGFTFTTNKTGSCRFVVNHPGKHHLISALFAIWTGLEFGMESQEIQMGLLAFKPSGMRMEQLKIDNRTFINDAYNANPDSMKAAIDMLNQMEANRKVAVIGDMLELGSFSEACHRSLATQLMSERGFDLVILVGDQSRYTFAELQKTGYACQCVHHVTKTEDAYQLLQQLSHPGDLILIKGSRSMGMEKIIHRFMEGED